MHPNPAVDPPSLTPTLTPEPEHEGVAPRKPRWRIPAGVLAVLMLLLGGTWLAHHNDEDASQAPRAAPPIDLENLTPGQPRISLAALRGRPVVVNFWATWCVPCRSELPAFEAEHEALGDRVVFMGVNHQDSREYATELFSRVGVRYPSGYDPTGATATAFGLYGMPTTVLIDPDGRIVEQHTGELSRDRLDELLRTKLHIA